MATINAVIVPAKALRGGKHKVRIAVSHNSQTRYIVTDIILNSAREFRNGSIVNRPDSTMLNIKLQKMIINFQQRIEDTSYVNCLSCPELVSLLREPEHSSRMTLAELREEYEAANVCKDSTASARTICWNAICGLVSPDIILERIDHRMVTTANNNMKKRLADATRRNYMGYLRSLLKFAIRHGYVQYKVDPFVEFSFPKARIRKSWLTVDEIKMVRDRPLKSNAARMTRDLFMLSYYLGGMNCKDIVSINFKRNRHRLVYKRSKTQDLNKPNEFVEFDVPEEAKEILAKITGADGYVKATESQRRGSFSERIRTTMNLLRNELNMPNLCFYSARKSFSQHAFDLGIRESVIDYILGHKLAGNSSGSSCLYSYIYVTPQMATEAIRKVLDNLK